MRVFYTIGKGWRGLGLAGLAALGSCGEPEPGGAADDAVSPAAEEARPPVIGKASGPDLSRIPRSPGDAQAMLGFPSPEAKPRSFRRLSAAEAAEVEALVEQFRRTEDIGARMEILDELEQFYGEALLGAVAEALESPEDDLRAYAVEKIRGNISPRILDALAPAMEDESVWVRIAALEAVTQVREAAVVDFVARGFSDEATEVRHAALSASDALMEQNKIAALDRAMQAPYQDVISLAIGELEVEGSPEALEAIFQGIDSSDPDVQAEARFAVEWMIEEEFATAAEARAWWEANRRKFDRELVPRE